MSVRARIGRGPEAAAVAAGLAVVLLAAACGTPTPTAEMRWREARERAVKEALPSSARAGFAGLAFYPFSPDHRVRGMIQPITPPQPLRLATSDGRVRPAQRVGRLAVELPEGSAVLALYRLLDSPDPNHLFLPFRDASAGRETYGAGRYVEVRRLPGGVVEVDFNRAYNPDCAYGIVAQCPVTPDENTVSFPIRAGERMPAGEH